MKSNYTVGKHLSSNEVEQIVKSAVASNRLEGLVMTSEEIDMLRRYVSGDIVEREYECWIFQHAGLPCDD